MAALLWMRSCKFPFLSSGRAKADNVVLQQQHHRPCSIQYSIFALVMLNIHRSVDKIALRKRQCRCRLRLADHTISLHNITLRVDFHLGHC